MRVLRITRKKMFRASLVPLWIVTKMPKAVFMERFGLESDVELSINGQGATVKRMDFKASDYGVPIKNGKTLELTVDDLARSFFVMTGQGMLSNEMPLDDSPLQEFVIDVDGGMSLPCYPIITKA